MSKRSKRKRRETLNINQYWSTSPVRKKFDVESVRSEKLKGGRERWFAFGKDKSNNVAVKKPITKLKAAEYLASKKDTAMKGTQMLIELGEKRQASQRKTRAGAKQRAKAKRIAAARAPKMEIFAGPVPIKPRPPKMEISAQPVPIVI
jgi:hypothetical protein